MRRDSRLFVLLLVGTAGVLYASRGEAQSFYVGGGRVFGCPANATLSLNGTGPTQQGDCTLYQTGSIVPAVPIETWVAAQVSGGMAGLQTQNEKLQKQIDDLTARIQALEAAAQQRGSAVPVPKPDR
ncbi:MAG: hypothetical protein ACRELZ_12730 [Candidatus Rokuibacteriota bacterium]